MCFCSAWQGEESGMRRAREERLDSVTRELGKEREASAAQRRACGLSAETIN